MLVGKFWLRLDIREHGSGNIGMTNVMRVGGKSAGILTFVLDFLKGTASVLFAKNLLTHPDLSPEALTSLLSLVAVITVCGHIFSVFLKFKGGKGVSTLFGVLAVVHLKVALFAGGIWIGMFLLKRTSSLSALTMLFALPLLFSFAPQLSEAPFSGVQSFLFTLLSLLMIYRHRDNIARLVQGKEGKL